MPKKTLIKMLQRFERNVTVGKLLKQAQSLSIKSGSSRLAESMEMMENDNVVSIEITVYNEVKKLSTFLWFLLFYLFYILTVVFIKLVLCHYDTFCLLKLLHKFKCCSYYSLA